jgi:hypothetical protein
MAEKASYTYIAGTWQEQKYIWFGKYERKAVQINNFIFYGYHEMVSLL